MEEVVNSGSYGCVLRPSLGCIGRRPRDGSFISKLFFTYENEANYDKTNANIEWKESIKIKRFDPHQEFTIQAIEKCETDTSQISPLLMSQCPNTIPKIATEIIYPDGGIDMFQFIVGDTSLSIAEFMAAFTFPLIGCARFARANMMHTDIKLENIVYKKERKRFLLIDFGLVTKSVNLYNQSHAGKRIRAFEIYYYPPEFIIYDNLVNGSIRDVKKNLSLLTKFIGSETNSAVNMFVYDSVEMNSELNQAQSRMEMEYKKDRLRNYKKMASAKVDVFSLALCVYTFLNIKKPTVENEHREALCKWIAGAGHINPYKRWTSEQAVQEWSILSHKIASADMLKEADIAVRKLLTK